MPARARYESPSAQLLRLAVQARADGLDFAAFWHRALRPGQPLVTRHRSLLPEGCVVWPRDTFDRQNDMRAIYSTKRAWRRAYEGLPPTRGDLAVQALGPALSGFAVMGERESAHEREPAVAA